MFQKYTNHQASSDHTALFPCMFLASWPRPLKCSSDMMLSGNFLNLHMIVHIVWSNAQTSTILWVLTGGNRYFQSIALNLLISKPAHIDSYASEQTVRPIYAVYITIYSSYHSFPINSKLGFNVHSPYHQLWLSCSFSQLFIS